MPGSRLVTCVERSAVSAENLGRFVGCSLLGVGHEVATILARMLGKAIEPDAKVLEAVELPPGHRLERGLVAGRRPEIEEVIEAERRVRESRGPARIARAAGHSRDGCLHGGGPLRTRDARRPLARVRESVAELSAARRPTLAESADASLNDGGEEHRGPEDASCFAPVRRDELGDVAAAERLLPLEIGAKAEVENALVDDRIHDRLLGARPDGAQRAAGGTHGFEETHVHDVGCERFGRGASAHRAGTAYRTALSVFGSAARISGADVTMPKPARARTRRATVARTVRSSGSRGSRSATVTSAVRWAGTEPTCDTSMWVATPRRRQRCATPSASKSPAPVSSACEAATP